MKDKNIHLTTVIEPDDTRESTDNEELEGMEREAERIRRELPQEEANQLTNAGGMISNAGGLDDFIHDPHYSGNDRDDTI